MGSNTFSIMGEIGLDSIHPETDAISIADSQVPIIRATTNAGNPWTGDKHEVLLMGASAQPIYEWLQVKSPVHVLGQGYLKTYGGRMYPVMTYAKFFDTSLSADPKSLAATLATTLPEGKSEILITELQRKRKK